MDRSAFLNTFRTRQLLAESGLAAMVVNSPENIIYYSGFYDMDIGPLKGTHFVLWPSDSDPVFVTHSRGPGFGNIGALVRDQRHYPWAYVWEPTWGSPAPTPVQLLAEAIEERGLARDQIGLEMRNLAAPLLDDLRQRLPKATFVDSTYLSHRIRVVKTAAEIEHLRWAARATTRAIQTAYLSARPGDLEKDVADWIGYHVTRYGADLVNFNVVASGERIGLGHHFAERAPLQRGDLLRVDYGAWYSGYTTDLVRMAVVGPPNDRQASTYAKVVELQRRMVERVRPGAVPADLVQRSLAEYAAMGLPPDREVFGHCIGLEIHERPIWTVQENEPLEAGMVICVEHGWMDQTANERYHVEDMYVVTADGAELLSDSWSIDQMHVIE